MSGGERKHELSQGEKVLLRRIGLKIHKDLHDQGRPVEWLAFNVGVARSSIREIIAGRSNPRLLTLTSIAKGLGYRNLVDFLISI
ncbi:MAG: helix-turn-helix domain-containing protein [Oligoflexia bacterium]|nr:helix-turn-helix domain-containing protein [Oligoflexia bacterium]